MRKLYTNGKPWWWKGCPDKNWASGNKARDLGGGEGYDIVSV